ncbi:MAG TPA: phosphatidate cytidylyltransferase [Syntrophales bacterium]|nr:phosphatidate cytidylyltransferase [Syntrophales bacterium]HOM06980.1 phosphatidate cytidylyltransferase [Syntrophales bacterium]HPQ06520.1 phosphatidate cytidylyltransferase [Syntrophales bacterium]
MERSHLQRWLTALVLVPLLFAVVAWGSQLVFTLFVAFFMLAGVWEYNGMAFGEGQGIRKIGVLVFSVVVPVAFYLREGAVVLGIVTLAVPALFILHLATLRGEAIAWEGAAKAVFGVLYIPLLLSHLIWLRGCPDGVFWVFFVVVIAFSGDVAAYYVGRRFGRTRLCPAVSQGKSVAGTVALVVASTVAALIYRELFLPGLPVLHAAWLGLSGSVTGQLGDLCESLLKRSAGVKDSGTLLPGHGGVLDRLDCLLFISPYVYYYRLWVAG